MKSKLFYLTSNLALCLLLVACQFEGKPESKDPLPKITTVPTILPQPSQTAQKENSVLVDGETPSMEHLEEETLENDLTIEAFIDANDAILIYSRDNGLYYYIDPYNPQLLQPDNILSSIQQIPSPGSSLLLEFSNFTNWLAYMDREAHVWITDLTGQEQLDTGIQLSSLARTDIFPTQSKLIWTPDDEHLIITGDGEAWIYHMRTRKFEPWDYQCDQLAISPKTLNIAVWCEKVQTKKYAVLEWGGNLWYSDVPPEKSILEVNIPENRNQNQVFSLYSIASWSSNGEKISYFNPNEKHQVEILDAQGNLERKFDIFGQPWAEIGYLIVDNPLQWSKNGTHLLIYGRIEHGTSCVKDTKKSFFEQEGSSLCWHVFDVETGESIWQPAIMDNQQYLDADKAAISADGKWLALVTRTPPFYSLVITNLEDREVNIIPGRISSIRWRYEN